jgi:1-deoxy-D-xylulose-5-phosphate reductoisomerase
MHYDNIKMVLHKENIIHYMVVFVDGTYPEQFDASEIYEPIQYAFTYLDQCSMINEKKF